MKQSAYGQPIYIDGTGVVTKLEKSQVVDEQTIQELIFQHVECLPISDIEESYNPLVPICMELNTLVGAIDIFMVSPDGELCIIETKLWRNPEARRKVVAQILDYAKELTRWSYEDLQREVNRRLKSKGNSLYEIVKQQYEELMPDEAYFVDSVSRNLRRGKFLLLIVGDGIKENALAISEFLNNYAHLNFSLAMVQLNIFSSDGVNQLIIPQTLVKTVEISRIMIDIPDGVQISTDNPALSGSINSRHTNNKDMSDEYKFYQEFWQNLTNDITFDDPSQPKPNRTNRTNLYLYPSNSKQAWISAYFAKSMNQIGVYFRIGNSQQGKEIFNALQIYQEDIKNEIMLEQSKFVTDDFTWNWQNNATIAVTHTIEDIFSEDKQEEIKAFFLRNLNLFVNVFRPRLKNIY